MNCVGSDGAVRGQGDGLVEDDNGGCGCRWCVCGVLEVVCGGDDVVEMVLWRLCVCVEIVWWR